jgi:hypothetical protein
VGTVINSILVDGRLAGYDLFERWLPEEKPAGFEDAVVESCRVGAKGPSQSFEGGIGG